MSKDALINIFDRSGRQLKWLSRACSKLAMVADISKMSSIYIDEFENEQDTRAEKSLVISLLLKSTSTSEELLKNIQRIEAEIKTEATQDVMDILFLTFGDELKMTPGLTLPHPRLHLQPQLLYPSAEVMGAYVHPVLNKTLRELAGSLGIKWGRYFEQGSRLLDFS